MSLLNQLKSRLTEQFENAKPTGANSRAPRNGHYFIKDVDFVEIPEKGTVPLATVLWKNSKDEPFVKDVTFPVYLSSLNIGEPLDYMNMVNKAILIYDVQVENPADNSTKPWISCKYEVISESPAFTTLQSQVVNSLGGKSSTVNNAYKEFEKNLGIDLTGAIDDEAPNDDAPDAQDDEK